MKEEWKYIKGFGNFYQVSSLGRVRLLDRYQYNPVAATHRTFIPGHIMNGVISNNGYLMVGLRDIKGKRKNCLVHRLVALAFVHNPLNLPVVNHKDCNKLNNAKSNLEWCTPLYNVHYAKADELRSYNQSRNKSVKQYTLDGMFIRSFHNITTAAKECGSHRGVIRKCCEGLYAQAGGYKWSYI